jgi:hypothetical protein
MDVTNSSEGRLVLRPEPLGEDRWLKPEETLRIRSDYTGQDLAFSVDFSVGEDDRAANIENVSVYVEGGSVYAEVTDALGHAVECGYQRPPDVDAKWRAVVETLKREQESRSGSPDKS